MREDLRKLFSIFGQAEKRKFALQVFLMIVSSFLEVVGVGAIPIFLIFIASPEKLKEYPQAYNFLTSLGLLESTGKLLLVGTLSLGFFFLCKNLFLLYVSYLNSKFLMRYKLRLEKKLYTAYLHAPYLFHLSTNTSRFITNLSAEIRILIINVLMPLFKLINFGVLTISIVALLLITEPLISLAIFFVLGSTMAIFLSRIRKKIRQYGQEEQKQRNVMIRWINQTFGGVKDIRILTRESYFQGHYFDSIHKSAKAGLYNQIISNVPKPLVETVSVFAMLSIIFFLVSQGKAIESIVSTLVLFGAAFIRLMPAVQALASNYSFLKYSTHAIQPIYEDVKNLEDAIARDTSVEPLHFKSAISLNKIWFAYPNTSRDVLSDINLTIQAGQSVAFVGPSGSGKTTLVDVLMGLIPPDKGEILVDNNRISENPVGWFKNIGYVPQSIYLIDDTIRRNIAFGINDDKIDEERIKDVLEEAQLTEFVNDLANGLDTPIGERGVRLSGGQRQRIGIARALYHNPQVLVLDEATSALDNVTERYIIEAIERFKRKRTVIMIAHRLTTVRKCDRLYFMSKGKIANSGTYDELVAMDNEFKKIAQF